MTDVHKARWIDHQLTYDCGVTGPSVTSSTLDELVDCPACLKLNPVPVVKAYCRPETDDPVYECTVCGEFHTQAGWAEYLDQRYDGPVDHA